MKVVTTNISAELKAMQPMLGRGGDLQASHCYFIEADMDTGVSITAMNFSVGMKMKVFGQVAQPGKFVAPVEIADLLAGAAVVTLDVNGANTLQIKVDKSFDGKLKGLPSEEYPPIPQMKRLENQFKLSVEAFEQLLGVAQYADRHTAGKIIEGLKLSWREASGKHQDFKISALAADGSVAAVTVVSGKGSASGEVIIPAQSAAMLQKFAAYVPDGEWITVGLEKSSLCVKTKETQAWVTVMPGQYPDIGELFQGQPDMVGKLELGSLIAQMKIAHALVRSAETHRAGLTFSPQGIKIAVTSQERGSGTAQVACETHSQLTIEKGFGVPLLLSALDALKRITGECSIQLGNYQDRRKPLFIKAQTDQGQITVLVLPMVDIDRSPTGAQSENRSVP